MIRTTVQTKLDTSARPDEVKEDEDGVEMEALNAKTEEEPKISVISGKNSKFSLIFFHVVFSRLRMSVVQHTCNNMHFDNHRSSQTLIGALYPITLNARRDHQKSISAPSPVPLHLRLIRWFCGFTDESDQHQREMDQHLESVSSLHRSRTQKAILYANLAVILGLAVFMYAYFCVSPFTAEEIDAFRERAMENRTV